LTFRPVMVFAILCRWCIIKVKQKPMPELKASEFRR